mgnify:CR=1 FL=1
MELFSTPWDIFSSLFVFLFGLIFSININKYFKVKKIRSAIIYLWHTFFCVLYLNYVLNKGGDALWYYQLSQTNDIEFSFGTIGIVVITMFFSSILNLSLFGTFLAFNIFGYIGLLAFDASLQQTIKNKSKLFYWFITLLVFLPSISFWSSAIGKDSLAFMATGLALWSTVQIRQRPFLLFLAIFIMLISRPHIAALMLIAFIISIIAQKKLPLIQRIIFCFIGLSCSAILIPFAMNYAGLSQLDQLTEYVEQRQSYNQEGTGGIDIAAMNTPLKLFTYLFRPLPFEANSIFALAASLDNIILLGLFLCGSISIIKGVKQKFHDNRIFLWIYAISCWFVLGFTTANLGISLRQKWMFTPIFIYLFISILGKKRKTVSGINKPLVLSDQQKHFLHEKKMFLQ